MSISLLTPFLISRYEPNLEIKIEDLITDSNGSTNQRTKERTDHSNERSSTKNNDVFPYDTTKKKKAWLHQNKNIVT